MTLAMEVVKGPRAHLETKDYLVQREIPSEVRQALKVLLALRGWLMMAGQVTQVLLGPLVHQGPPLFLELTDPLLVYLDHQDLQAHRVALASHPL